MFTETRELNNLPATWPTEANRHWIGGTADTDRLEVFVLIGVP